MRLPGVLEDRVAVLASARCQLLAGTEIVRLEDEEVRVDVSLDGAARCIRVRFEPTDIQFLRETTCADFAVLLERGEGEFEAHVIEHKKSISEKSWIKVQEQLEWALVRVLAVAGVIGVRIQGVSTYTAFSNDKLSREGSANLVGMKIPVGVEGSRASEDGARRWVEARRSWERGRIRLEVFKQDVEHRPISAGGGGRASVACRTRPSPGEEETRWLFEPVAG